MLMPMMNNTVKIMISQTAFFGMRPPREVLVSPARKPGGPLHFISVNYNHWQAGGGKFFLKKLSPALDKF
jgi:hypothetical protein